MARRHRRRGTGAIIRVRQLSGVGNLKNPNSMSGALFPVLVGGGVTLAITLGIRSLMEPSADNAAVRENAAWVGAGGGVLSGLVMYNLTSQPAGAAAIATALVVGGAMFGLEYAAKMVAERAAAGAGGAAMSGVGAVVPEYSMRGLGAGRRGTGAIVMEPTSSRGYGAGAVGRVGGVGSYGEVVNLGSINPNVFGTAGVRGFGGRR